MIPQYVIVHHSLTRDTGTVSWGAIRRYHVETMGWRDIGYHAGVELVSGGMSSAGRKYYEALMGRPLDEQGAHAKQNGMNSKSLGICVVGNWDVEAPPMEQVKVAAGVIACWCRLFHIPIANVLPHSAYADKTCPGTQFPMNKLKGLVDSLV